MKFSEAFREDIFCIFWIVLRDVDSLKTILKFLVTLLYLKSLMLRLVNLWTWGIYGQSSKRMVVSKRVGRRGRNVAGPPLAPSCWAAVHFHLDRMRVVEHLASGTSGQWPEISLEDHIHAVLQMWNHCVAILLPEEVVWLETIPWVMQPLKETKGWSLKNVLSPVPQKLLFDSKCPLFL